jgi:hypothetical protein
MGGMPLVTLLSVFRPWSSVHASCNPGNLSCLSFGRVRPKRAASQGRIRSARSTGSSGSFRSARSCRSTGSERQRTSDPSRYAAL